MRIFNVVFIGIIAFIAFSHLIYKDSDDDKQVVNVYSSRKEELVKNLFHDFTEISGIKVNYITDKAPKLIAKLEREGGNSPADVLLTSDIANLQLAEDLNLLQSISSKILEDNIPSEYRDEDKRWYGLSKRARVVFYAKDRVDVGDLSTYEDLSNPKWRGKIAIRSSNNVYNRSLVSSMIEAEGIEKTKEWMKGLVANFARKPQGGDTDQIRSVAAGESDIAVANSYYYGRLSQSDRPEDREVVAKVGIFFPDQDGKGAHVNISGAGVTRSSKNTDNAIKLLEFLSETQAQQAYAQANSEFPVNKEAKVPQHIQAWTDYELDEDSLKKFSEYNSQAIKLFDEVGWR